MHLPACNCFMPVICRLQNRYRRSSGRILPENCLPGFIRRILLCSLRERARKARITALTFSRIGMFSVAGIINGTKTKFTHTSVPEYCEPCWKPSLPRSKCRRAIPLTWIASILSKQPCNKGGLRQIWDLKILKTHCLFTTLTKNIKWIEWLYEF